MTEFVVYIETKGDPISGQQPTAHVPSLPGASASGQTIAEAKEKIGEAIKAYLTLLHEAGEPVPEPGKTINLHFQEVDHSILLSDYDALHDNERELLLRWLAISRQELIALVMDLPEELATLSTV